MRASSGRTGLFGVQGGCPEDVVSKLDSGGSIAGWTREKMEGEEAGKILVKFKELKVSAARCLCVYWRGEGKGEVFPY